MKPPHSDNSVLISVKITPNASIDSIVGWEGDCLKIKIRAVPEKGKANKQLIEYLADRLDIAKTRITIQSGNSSRLKRIRIEGISEEDVRQKLTLS